MVKHPRLLCVAGGRAGAEVGAGRRPAAGGPVLPAAVRARVEDEREILQVR